MLVQTVKVVVFKYVLRVVEDVKDVLAVMVHALGAITLAPETVLEAAVDATIHVQEDVVDVPVVQVDVVVVPDVVVVLESV